MGRMLGQAEGFGVQGLGFRPGAPGAEGVVDRETIDWLRGEVLGAGDVAIARACARALEGDERGLLVVRETLEMMAAAESRGLNPEP